jgi:hypothetical protein
MIKRLAALAFLALASSAAAYTYTSEEGRFTVEISYGERQLIEHEGSVTIWLGTGERNLGVDDITVLWGDTDSENVIDAFGKPFGILKAHDILLSVFTDADCVITDDKYLTNGEARRMNVDEGFIFFFKPLKVNSRGIEALFVKGRRLYRIHCKAGGPNGEEVIKTLNSFRALD